MYRQQRNSDDDWMRVGRRLGVQPPSLTPGLIRLARGEPGERYWPACRHRSHRRIPWHRDLPIARPTLLDVRDAREWIVEALHEHLLGCKHVVDLASGLHGQLRIVVEHRAPIRIAHEEC